MPRTAKYLVLVPMALLLWVFFGPQPLGGRAAYVTTRGISMEPRYTQGDLVVVQRASDYGPGDIIAYKSGTLKTIVLHRIVGRDQQGFVTKGDNNTWLDPDRVRSADVIGKAWFHIPGAGKVLAPLRNPPVTAALAAALGLSFLLGGRRLSRRQRERRRGERKSGNVVKPQRISVDRFTDAQKRWLGVMSAIGLASLLIFLVTLVRPAVKDVSSGFAYTHNGSFTYSAEVEPNTVYPDGAVSTGDPIFTRVVDQVTVGFNYQLHSRTQALTKGYISLNARVLGDTGWTKPLLIGEPVPFSGTSAKVEGILDLTEVGRIADRVQRVTGIAENAQSIEVTPSVLLQGHLGGQQVNEEFAPQLDLVLDAFQLKVGAEGSGLEALSVSKPGTVKASELAANNFSFFGIEVPHSGAKTGSLVGLVATVILLVVLWRRFSNPAHADEPALIEAEYAAWLVPVEAMRSDPQRSVQVQGFQALMRLAELYERMILHAASDGHHTYFIEEEGVVYYYETSDAKKASAARPSAGGPPPPPPPPPPPVPRRLKETQDPERLRRLRQELKEIEQNITEAGPRRPEE